MVENKKIRAMVGNKYQGYETQKKKPSISSCVTQRTRKLLKDVIELN